MDQLWLVERGTGTQYFGDLEDYFKDLMTRRALTRKERRDEDADGRKSRKDARREAAEARERVAPLKKEIRQAEEELEALNREMAEIDTQLSDPAVYERDPDKVANLVKRKRELETSIESVEERWLDAQAQLEEIEDV